MAAASRAAVDNDGIALVGLEFLQSFAQFLYWNQERSLQVAQRSLEFFFGSHVEEHEIHIPGLHLLDSRLAFIGANDKVSGVASRANHNYSVSVNRKGPGHILSTAQVGQIFPPKLPRPAVIRSYEKIAVP